MLARASFIRRHHHLIVPLLYDPREIARRDQLLLQQNWELADVMREHERNALERKADTPA